MSAAPVLTLRPHLLSSVTALVALSGPDAAIALLKRLRESFADRLTGYEAMARICIAFVVRHMSGLHDPLPGHAWYALVQLDDSAPDRDLASPLEDALAAALEARVVLDAAIAQSEREARALWRLREDV